MGVDLRSLQLPEHTGQGRITGADRRSYARRGTRAKPSVADALVESGAPLVLEMYSSGQFEWFAGDAARLTWTEVRPYVSATTPTAKQLAKHQMWNAGIWRSDDGTQLVYLTGSC